MRILHIIDHIGLGGAQTILKSIFEKEKSNRDIFCYALRNNEIKVEIDHPNSHSYAGYSKFDIKPLFELKKLIEDQNIDVLHCHLVRSMAFGYLAKLLFFKDIKLIFHEHGRIFENQTWYNRFVRKAQNRVDLFIAVSEATKEKLIKNAEIREHEVKVLYNFVDMERFDPAKTAINRSEERRKIDVDDMDFVIGFAGRHVERKGCRDLILAVSELQHHKDIKLLILGDGPKKEEYVQTVNELGLGKNIRFLGFIPDVRWFYSLIDCIVIPSHWEPSPMLFYEVQSMGVPLISSNAESLNELVVDGYNGVVFNARDVTDLKRKILELYQNQDLKNDLIKNSLENAKKYSIDAYLGNIEAVYHSLTGVRNHVR